MSQTVRGEAEFKIFQLWLETLPLKGTSSKISAKQGGCASVSIHKSSVWVHVGWTTLETTKEIEGRVLKARCVLYRFV